MKLHFTRNKPRQIFFSIMYRLSKLPFMSPEGKLRMFLHLHWIFWRLSFEQGAKIYGFADDSMRIKNLQFLFSRLSKDQRVMDIGCKWGEVSALIAERTRSVVGVDHDKSAIDTAQANQSEKSKSNLNFVHADAYTYLTTNSEKFDVLILSHMIEYLENPGVFLLKFRDFFTYFYIEVQDFDESYLNHYRYRVKSSLIYTDDTHIWEFDRDSFSELLTSAGLKIVASDFRYGLQKYWCEKA